MECRDPRATADEDWECCTALHRASSAGHQAVVALLLRHMEPGPRDCQQRTPLHCAAARGCLQVVQLLLQAGAVVLAADKQRNTALHLAARYGHAKVLSLLLAAHRGDTALAATNLAGESPLTVALAHGSREAALVLLVGPGWRAGVGGREVRELITRFPDLARVLLNNCITSNLHSNSQDGQDGVAPADRDLQVRCFSRLL